MLSLRRILGALTVAYTLAFASAPAIAQGPPEVLRVVATLPDLADIASQVGGDAVQVDCIARGKENLHSVRLRPSHMVSTHRADLFVQVGLALEHAWVPGLLEASRNSRIAKDGPLSIGSGWPNLVEIPLSLDRSEGVCVHPLGNPHVNLCPSFGAFAARKIRDRLKSLRPELSEKFDANCAAYEGRIAERAKRWKRIAALLKGRKVVQYHKEFSYLCIACGIEGCGALEPKPGVPPTPAHLAKMAVKMRDEEVKVVLRGAWTPLRLAQDAAARGGAKAVEVPVMTEKGETWLDFMDRAHETLLQAWDLTLPEDDPKMKAADD